MKWYRKVLISVFLVLFISVSVQVVSAYSVYENDVSDDITYTWRYTTFNQELLDQMNQTCNFSLSSLSSSNITYNSTIQHEIQSMGTTATYWQLGIHSKIGNETVFKSKTLKMYRSPQSVPEDWISNIKDENLRYIPVDDDNYLYELKSRFSSNSNLTVYKYSSRLSIYKFFNDTTIIADFKYNSDGVLNYFQIKVNYSTAIYLSLVEDHLDELTVIIGIFVALVIFGVIAGVAMTIAKNSTTYKSMYKNRYKKKKPINGNKYNYGKPAPSARAKIETKAPNDEKNSNRKVLERYELLDDDKIFNSSREF